MNTAPVMSVTEEMLEELDSKAVLVGALDWFDAEDAMGCTGICPRDAEYIAAAKPVTVQALIATIRQQRAELERLRAAPVGVPAPAAQEPHTYWVLFDAEAERPFIKKMMPEGFLAFFDSESDAMRTKARNPGTDYKQVDYYAAPPAAEQPECAHCSSSGTIHGTPCGACTEQPDTVKVPRGLLEQANAWLLDVTHSEQVPNHVSQQAAAAHFYVRALLAGGAE